jgi:hypothetical protein
VPPDVHTTWAHAAMASLAGSRAARERLARGGLAAVAGRSWEASLCRLAAGWHRALDGKTIRTAVAAAPRA